MSDIARLRDADGKVHYTARASKFAREGLADGSLVDIDEEAANAAANAANGDDLDTGKPDRRPSKRQRTAGNTDDSNGSGVAEPAPSS